MAKETKKEKNVGMAVLAYFIFFFPLLTPEKNDPFVKFHVKQSLMIVVTLIAIGFLRYIPILGWTIFFFTPIFLFVVFIIGVNNAYRGKKKNLPFIGQFAEEWFKF